MKTLLPVMVYSCLISCRDPLAGISDVIPQPIFGPSLSIGGHTAQWNGPRSKGTSTGQVGVPCRVIFEANVGDRITSYLNICNDGTTAIYFSWKVSTMIKIGQLQDCKVNESNGLFHGFLFFKFPYSPVREYPLTLMKR